MRIAVIGAGFGGLSAACYLAKAGHDVTIYEKNSEPGGRARTFEAKGFTFDMGPSWYLMPEVFEEFFADMGHTITYKAHKLDPNYRIFFSDKTKLDVVSDENKMAQVFKTLEPNGDEKFRKWLDLASYQYKIGLEEFVNKNYDSVFDFFNWRILRKGARMKIFSNLDGYSKSIFTNEKSRQILLYTTVFLGGSPKNTPAIYSLMAHADFRQGVFWIEGGIARLVTEFVAVAKKLGVSFEYNSEVTEVTSVKKRVTAMRTKNTEIIADSFVVNGDYAHFDLDVLQKKQHQYSKKSWEKRVVAPSAFILYLGVNKKIPKLQHHTMIFNEWQKHFETVFDSPSWPVDPSYYVCAPSKSDDSVAPEGKENLFVLIPMPSGIEDTPEQRKKLRDWTIKNMESFVGEFAEDIIYEKSYCLKDFKKDYNAYKGNALGLAHTLMQTAIFRPRNASSKLSNLFYVGQYTVPGVGMPMVVISGKLVGERVDNANI